MLSMSGSLTLYFYYFAHMGTVSYSVSRLFLILLNKIKHLNRFKCIVLCFTVHQISFAMQMESLDPS